MLFTSGTTGPSKGVVMSHAHQVSFGTSFNNIVSLKKADTTYNYLPFFHIAAKFLALGSLEAGAKMALTPTFSLSRFWPDVKKFEATVCIAVGAMSMLRGLPPANSILNSLRLIMVQDHEFLKGFEKRFQLEIAEGYGSTRPTLSSTPTARKPRRLMWQKQSILMLLSWMKPAMCCHPTHRVRSVPAASPKYRDEGLPRHTREDA